MQTHWTFEGCDRTEISAATGYWAEKQAAFEGKMATLPVEPDELRLGIYHSSEPMPSPWEIQASLHLPAHTVVAESVSDDLGTALDQILERLAREIDRQQETEEKKPRRRRTQRRRNLRVLLPFLERSQITGRSKLFFAFLHPILRSLRRYARRELQMFEVERGLPGEQLTTADVLDEAMIRAWEHFADRPRHMPLDLWLIQLFDEVLADAIRASEHESLQDRFPEPVRGPDDRASLDSWTELVTYGETLELGELIPGAPGLEGWDRLDLETKQAGLAELLGKLPRRQQRVLLLYAAEGFEPAEIADFQDRSEKEVLADIEAARRTLQHHLIVDAYLPEEEEFGEPRGRHRRRRR